ncbi:Ribosome recycling factor [invertebrate metagenome]|uniref:Ribosome recycling factor n=1 Tax=invertebrate metagenome TaxID=1711999 RepID=A0A484H7F1_9ZZZZ
MTITYQELKKDLCHRMDMAVEVLRKEFAGLRTGRASPNLLDTVMVEAYGAVTPLIQLATISVLEPRLLAVQVWDRSIVKAVEKAIRDASLGLNPASEGQYVRVPIPPLSEERRVELVKVAHRYAEQARVAVRNVRRDGMESLKKMEKDGTISQDLQRQHSQDIQIVTDEHVQQIDELLLAKEKEVIQV